MARNKYPEETVKLIIDEALKLFIEKGYENTSIQDIINHLGGLSKGAIYHHFKSKDEIFEAVCEKIGHQNSIYFGKIRDDKYRNGCEKLKAMIHSVYANPTNEAIVAVKGRIIKDPKFLANQIIEIYELVVPQYIQPIIEEGIRDGSIETDHPKELSEVILTLLNIWANPIITKTTEVEMYQKITFFSMLLKGIGLDILDEEAIKEYAMFCKRFNQ